MLLYLVRHALTRMDPAQHSAAWALDPAGADGLAALAGLPHWGGLPRIVSSSEPKALLTAEAIRSRHGLPPVEPYDDLREIRKGGWVENHDEVIAALFRYPERSPLAGWESGAEALARFSCCVSRLVAECGGQDLILVSHGNVLALYLAALQGKSNVDFAEWRSIRMPDYAIVDPVAGRVVQPFGAW